jgi:hypothetical protein
VDTGFPSHYIQGSVLKYKKVSKKGVLKLMKGSGVEYIEAAQGKYYTGGYYGDVYLKNGKVSVVMTVGD